MAENSFRPLKGDWITKEYTLKVSAGAVEVGDMMMVTSGGVTVELGTNAATALVGISTETLANVAATQTIRIKTPKIKTSCTFVGAVTDGVLAVGDTDTLRGCDLEDHEGVDVDTDTHHMLVIVKGRVATADGATTAGEAEFKFAQLPEDISAF